MLSSKLNETSESHSRNEIKDEKYNYSTNPHSSTVSAGNSTQKEIPEHETIDVKPNTYPNPRKLKVLNLKIDQT